MASFIGHLSIGLLYWLFPGSFSLLGLAIGSQLPDLDSIFTFFRGLKKFPVPHILDKKKWKHLSLSIWFMDSPHEFHNVMGVLLTLPLGILFTIWLNSLLGITGEGLMLIVGSVLVGGLSHLVLDLPAHRQLRYFTLFEKEKSTPFVLFRNTELFRKRYPFTEVEVEAGYPKYFSLPLFNYLMLSNLFPVIAAALVFLVQAI